MVKKKKEKEAEVIVTKSKSNPKIEEIVLDYPPKILVYPRGIFEEQLRKHLLKHKVE